MTTAEDDARATAAQEHADAELRAYFGYTAPTAAQCEKLVSLRSSYADLAVLVRNLAVHSTDRKRALGYLRQSMNEAIAAVVSPEPIGARWSNSASHE